MTLRARLASIAAHTTDEVLAALKSASFEELSSLEGGGARVRGAGSAGGVLSYRKAKSRVLHDFETAYVTDLMKRYDGNVREAAKAAGISYVQLYRLMDRVGIKRTRRPR